MGPITVLHIIGFGIRLSDIDGILRGSSEAPPGYAAASHRDPAAQRNEQKQLWWQENEDTGLSGTIPPVPYRTVPYRAAEPLRANRGTAAVRRAAETRKARPPEPKQTKHAKIPEQKI